MDTNEACRQDRLTTVSVPIGDVDAVLDALVLFGDGLANPRARLVKYQRCLAALLWRFRLEPGERRIHQHLLAIAVDIGPSQAVRSRDAVDLDRLPGLPRIRAMLQKG